MEIVFNVPDDIAERLQSYWPDLPRRALEALVADAYRHQLLTTAQVRQILDLATRLEADAVLKQASAYLHYTKEDLNEDRRTSEELARANNQRELCSLDELHSS